MPRPIIHTTRRAGCATFLVTAAAAWLMHGAHALPLQADGQLVPDAGPYHEDRPLLEHAPPSAFDPPTPGGAGSDTVLTAPHAGPLEPLAWSAEPTPDPGADLRGSWDAAHTGPRTPTLGQVLSPFVRRAPSHERTAMTRTGSDDNVIGNVIMQEMAGQGTPSGGSAVTGSDPSLQEGLAQVLVSLIEPLVNIDGTLSFSILGIGAFDAALSADRNRLVLREQESGAQLTLSRPSNRPTAPELQSDDLVLAPLVTRTDDFDVHGWLDRIDRLQRTAIDFLTGPWVLTAIALALIARSVTKLAIARVEHAGRRRGSRRRRRFRRRTVSAQG